MRRGRRRRRHKGAPLRAEYGRGWATTTTTRAETSGVEVEAEELTARLCTLQRAEQGSDDGQGLTFRNGIHHQLTHTRWAAGAKDDKDRNSVEASRVE